MKSLTPSRFGTMEDIINSSKTGWKCLTTRPTKLTFDEIGQKKGNGTSKPDLLTMLTCHGSGYRTFVILETLTKLLLQHSFDGFSACCCLRILLLKRRKKI